MITRPSKDLRCVQIFEGGASMKLTLLTQMIGWLLMCIPMISIAQMYSVCANQREGVSVPVMHSGSYHITVQGLWSDKRNETPYPAAFGAPHHSRNRHGLLANQHPPGALLIGRLESACFGKALCPQPMHYQYYRVGQDIALDLSANQRLRLVNNDHHYRDNSINSLANQPAQLASARIFDFKTLRDGF